MPGRLDGSVALVTGAASGIGAGVVRRFVREGAEVVAMDRVDQSPSSHVVPVTGDVTNAADCARAVATAVDRFGKLDVLVPNAGIPDPHDSLADLTSAELDRAYEDVFAVNVKGALLIVHAALDQLISARGAIIFTGSISSLAPGFGGPLYVSSKHAVLGLAKHLALSLAGRVRVNTVAPGYVRTPLTEALSNPDEVIQRIPTGSLAEPDDIAGIYALLASRQDGSAITGSVYTVDSGQLLFGPNAKDQP